MYIYVHLPAFYVCKAHNKKILKLKFALKNVAKMAGMRIKKFIFTVKVPLIAPTLGGPGPP